MVLVKMLTHDRRERILQEGREEGLQEGREEADAVWGAWNQRREAHEVANPGVPFVEPPPSARRHPAS